LDGYRGILWTLGLVFFTTAAASFLNAGGDVFHMSASSWQAIVNAGIAAVLAFAINAVAPFIPRYGITLKK